MHLEKLSLLNFRNYQDQSFDFSRGMNLLIGNNAQGKTNCLEAVTLFSTGKSHRTYRDAEMISFGHAFAHLTLSYFGQDRGQKAQMVIAKDQKKRIKINDVPLTKMSDLMGCLNTVLFCPEHLELIKSGPKERRRFIDICISQMKPNYFYHLQQYAKILAQRNILLKNKNAKETLFVWNEKLVEHGVEITFTRNHFSQTLFPIVQRVHQEMTKENLSLSYESQLILDHELIKRDQLKEIYYKKLAQMENRELEQKMTLVGPHRDDLNFWIENKEVRSYASQGQQRSVVLSLKLAELEWMKNVNGESPILLLDDVLSELDSLRQSYILNAIEGKQVLITGTDLSHLSQNHEAKIFQIHEGKVLCN